MSRTAICRRGGVCGATASTWNQVANRRSYSSTCGTPFRVLWLLTIGSFRGMDSRIYVQTSHALVEAVLPALGQLVPGRRIAPGCGTRSITSVAVVVIMVMIMVVMMIVPMLLVMLAPAMLMRIRRVARIVGEHERLHRYRHGLRGHADAAEIDVVQIPQDDPVDDEQLAREIHFLPKYRPQYLCDVAVEYQKQRFFGRDGSRQTLDDALGKSCDALIRRGAPPAKDKRHVGFALHQIEMVEMAADAPRQFRGHDHLSANKGRLQHLQILSRQQFPGARDVDGVA